MSFDFHQLGICIDVKSSLGLLMDKFRQFLTELSARDTIMTGIIVLRFYLYKEDNLHDF